MSPEDVALARVLHAWEQWPDSDEDEEAFYGEVLVGLTAVLRQTGWVDGLGVVGVGRELVDRAAAAGYLP